MARGRKKKPIPAASATAQVKPPEWLSKEAKEEFRRLVALLTKQKVTSELDVNALEILATSMADYRKAQQMIDEHGSVVLSATGQPMKSPYLDVLKQAAQRIQPLYAEFGLTPSARAKLKLEHDPDAAKEDDEFGL